jgi:hypothetical protein
VAQHRTVPDVRGVAQVEVPVAGQELDGDLDDEPVAAAADGRRRGGRADAGRVQPALGLQQRGAAGPGGRRRVREQAVGLAEQVQLAGPVDPEPLLQPGPRSGARQGAVRHRSPLVSLIPVIERPRCRPRR